MLYVSLFSGVGGLDLGLSWAGWSPVLFAESDPFCRAVLGWRWPSVPIVERVEGVPGLGLRADAVVGGVPVSAVLGERAPRRSR